MEQKLTEIRGEKANVHLVLKGRRQAEEDASPLTMTLTGTGQITLLKTSIETENTSRTISRICFCVCSDVRHCAKHELERYEPSKTFQEMKT